MNAKRISLVIAAAMATSIAAIPFAHAGMQIMKEHQPHPGISERDARQLGICYLKFDPIASDNVVYIDSNPLHPTYSFTHSDTSWVGVGSTMSVPYVNSNNPLHPSFKR
jgi:hypothetical protein